MLLLDRRIVITLSVIKALHYWF